MIKFLEENTGKKIGNHQNLKIGKNVLNNKQKVKTTKSC